MSAPQQPAVGLIPLSYDGHTSTFVENVLLPSLTQCPAVHAPSTPIVDDEHTKFDPFWVKNILCTAEIARFGLPAGTFRR